MANCISEFSQNRTVPNHITFSPDDELFVSMSQDRLVRVFRFKTGKLYRKYDESLQVTSEMQQVCPFFSLCF